MTETAVAPRRPAPAGTPADAPLLATEGLEKRFGAMRAVRDVDLAMPPGEFLTVFGPNGAGKSTLLGLLAGRMRPTAGRVLLGGEPLDYGATEWRSRVGLLSHRSLLYGHLSARENLTFYGRLYGLPDPGTRALERLEQVGLGERADTRARDLSHGMRQRLSLARALLHDPELVLLDEPFTGLDPHAAGVLRRVLGSLRDGRRAVVMVTHDLGQGLALADRVAIQRRGRLVFDDAASRWSRADFERRYHAVVEGEG